MKLELKHLIDAYKYQDDIIGASDIWKIVKISDAIITLHNGKDYNDVEFNHFNIDYKIIKTPLSDLAKEIEVNGEKFVPIDKINENGEYGLLIGNAEKISLDNLFWEDKCEMNMLNIFEINKLNNLLCKWHFDIHGLIENGLAINKNTIL